MRFDGFELVMGVNRLGITATDRSQGVRSNWSTLGLKSTWISMGLSRVIMEFNGFDTDVRKVPLLSKSL